MTIPVAALDAGSKAVAWLWDKYGKALADKAAENLKKKWAEVQWIEAAQKYRARMLELHGTLRVLGKPEPVSLEGVFTDVFILDRPRAFRRFDVAQLREDPGVLSHWQTERVSGLRLVTQAKSRRLFILGPPGAGKTTFLKYLTLQAAQGKLDKIPIFVGLNEWSESGLELLPFIERQFVICAFPDAAAFIEHILEEGDALVLFDGLDEVRQEGEQRAKVVKVIRDFSNQYLKSQVLVTCRVAATEYELSDKFTYVELADFTEDQMRAYARKWFSDDLKKGRAFEREFFDEGEHRGLREMGRTPLLLAMLCLHFEETQTFPQRRVELYEEALDALLKKWDASRNIRRDDVYRKLSLGRKRELLATLAARGFDRGESFFTQEDLEQRIVAYLRTLPPADVDEDIDGEAVLKTIESQHGILVERAHRIHAFAHLSFQEYFTAKYVVERNALPRLFTAERISDRRWREVLLLTASLLYNADNFFEHFFRALNGNVRKDACLLALLRWADDKAHPFMDSYQVGALRAFYIYLARDLDLARALARNLDHAFARAFALSLALDLGLDQNLGYDRDRTQILVQNRECDFILNPTRDLNLDLEFTNEHNLACTLDLNNNLVCASDLARAHISSPLELILDISLVDMFYFAIIFSLTHQFKSVSEHIPTFAEYLNIVTLLAQRAQVHALAKALSGLTIPSPSTSRIAWEIFVNTIRSLLTYRDLHPRFNLSISQVKKLVDYLAATQLLVDCLALARVSDRAGIEARILQPPEVADNELGNE